jgi:hypothetical protein
MTFSVFKSKKSHFYYEKKNVDQSAFNLFGN